MKYLTEELSLLNGSSNPSEDSSKKVKAEDTTRFLIIVTEFLIQILDLIKRYEKLFQIKQKN